MISKTVTIPEITKVQSRVIAYAFVFLSLTVGYAFLRGSTWQSSTQLHTVMETAAALLALLVGVIAMVRSNKELEQFAFVATHDLQEPVRTVKSYTQLLAKRYKGKLDDEADDFLAYAADGAARMGILLNDLLSYSRIGFEGKKFEPTDCESVLSITLANAGTAIQERGGKVTHDPLPTLMADASQLEQVFSNIIDNALKYRSEEPSKVHVAARQFDGHWQFSIKDNGIGIDAQYAERIFTIFQRLHKREEYSGTGIGLAVCKKIVERHGGRIWVESVPGQGATFYFNIPSEVG